MTDLHAEQTWKILVELLTDLLKKNVEIPFGVNRDIQMAKSVINFYKVDPTDPERMNELKRMNDLLNSVQDVLLTLADTISDEYVESWVEKLKRASMGEQVYEIPKEKPKFVVGAPSGFSMSRITFKEPISEERLVDIAEYHNVILEFEDNTVLIFGSRENIQKSLKELSEFFKEQIEEISEENQS